MKAHFRAIAAGAALLAQDATGQQAAPRVHCVCDISQEFTFYMDGRFFRQYLEGHGEDARNWGSMAELDLSNANLLVLTGGDAHVPFAKASIAKIDAFLAGGGGVLMLLQDAQAPGNDIVRQHGLTASQQGAKDNFLHFGNQRCTIRAAVNSTPGISKFFKTKKLYQSYHKISIDVLTIDTPAKTIVGIIDDFR